MMMMIVAWLPWRRCASTPPLPPSSQDVPEGVLSEAHLATLEDNIRDALRMKRSVYEGSKELLLKLFQ